jgi:hypothetical protein
VLGEFVGIARALRIGRDAGVEFLERAARLLEFGGLPLGARPQVGVA